MAVQVMEPELQCDYREPAWPDGFTPLRLFEDVLAAVDHHVAEEAESVAAYRRLAEASGDPVVALLMRLVVDDEDHHHDLLVRIAATVRSILTRADSLDTLPRAEVVTGTPTKELIAVTRAFIREERDGARQLRTLALKTSGLNAGLPKLLLETMALDSDKHERILRFILRRLERRERAASRAACAVEEVRHGVA
jgi:hypothetical protein